MNVFLDENFTICIIKYKKIMNEHEQPINNISQSNVYIFVNVFIINMPIWCPFQLFPNLIIESVTQSYQAHEKFYNQFIWWKVECQNGVTYSFKFHQQQKAKSLIFSSKKFFENEEYIFFHAWYTKSRGVEHRARMLYWVSFVFILMCCGNKNIFT